MAERKPLDARTLRWASRKLRRSAKDMDDAHYASGYGDGGVDLLLAARAIEAKQKKQGRKRG